MAAQARHCSEATPASFASQKGASPRALVCVFCIHVSYMLRTREYSCFCLLAVLQCQWSACRRWNSAWHKGRAVVVLIWVFLSRCSCTFDVVFLSRWKRQKEIDGDWYRCIQIVPALDVCTFLFVLIHCGQEKCHGNQQASIMSLWRPRLVWLLAYQMNKYEKGSERNRVCHLGPSWVLRVTSMGCLGWPSLVRGLATFIVRIDRNSTLDQLSLAHVRVVDHVIQFASTWKKMSWLVFRISVYSHNVPAHMPRQHAPADKGLNLERQTRNQRMRRHISRVCCVWCSEVIRDSAHCLIFIFARTVTWTMLQ